MNPNQPPEQRPSSPGQPGSAAGATPPGEIEPTLSQDEAGLAQARRRSTAEINLNLASTVTHETHPTHRRGSMNPSPPAQVSGYNMIKPLGVGTYGEVWLAQEQGTG